jgi:diguanylate cyclase (GGDEF)-like protein
MNTSGMRDPALKNGAAALAAARQKSRFLRGNFKLLVSWPILACILGLIGWMVLFASLDDDKRDQESLALRESASLARGYAEQLSRTLEALDQTTLHVKYEWQLSGAKLQLDTLQDIGLFPPDAQVNVSITDRHGNILTSTLPGGTNIQVADRPFFQMQQTASQDSLYIGPPIKSRATDILVVHFSRRLIDVNGDFDGIVFLSIGQGFFTANYDPTILGRDGFLGLLGTDGVIRSARTGQSVATELLAAVPDLQMEEGSTILYGNKWFEDKRTRFVGWQTVSGFPMIAMTGLDEEEMLAPYWSNRETVLRYAWLASAALAAFTLIAMLLSLRLAWRKYRLEVTQATYRIATEAGNEGFYISRPVQGRDGRIIDFLIIDSNQRGAEIAGWRREEMLGKRCSLLFEGEAWKLTMRILCQAMEQGIYEQEHEMPPDSPSNARWLAIKAIRSGDEVAVTIRDISADKAHVAALEKRGNEDALTGLPNRYWMQSWLPPALERARAGSAMLALLYIDLDGFKSINDTMGHQAGDEVLHNAARRLKVAIRPHDHVVRLGGDEFVAIIENLGHKTDAAHVAERILRAFEEGFRLPQGMHAVGTSIGIAVFPSDGDDPVTLLKNADIAMYSVKTGGKGDYRFFDQRFYNAMRERREREAELRHAIAHDQLVIYYQLRIDLASGAACGMEALVRWEHPGKGLVEPLHFIPLAEETGQIVQLSEVVIDKVCAQLAAWERADQGLLPVSINISPRHFMESDIARTLGVALARHRVNPALLEIELTESSMMGNSAEISATLAAIQDMGIKLLVDDFGTGYSSLAQLQQLDVDVLKVDRAFTAGLEKSKPGAIFFTAIITMAHALDMRVVAEGVESAEQARILKSLHCDEIQGYYVARPLPAAKLQAALAQEFFLAPA